MKTSVKLKGTKRLFIKLGSCSRTLGFIMNRAFGELREPEERALDPLAGGIIQQGYQCGMLWGASLGAGAEAHRRCNGSGKAPALAMLATKQLISSFQARTQSPDCYDITRCDWESKKSIAGYFFSGRVVNCYKLIARWAPEAIETATGVLGESQEACPSGCRSCASEVVKRMGGSDEQAAMVAGFAGGLGLSGNACGALAAAIWNRTLQLIHEDPEKKYFFHPEAKEILERFYKFTDYEILCSTITGRTFATAEEHSEFLAGGGCGKLMDALSIN